MSLERKLISTLTDPNEISRIFDMGVSEKVFEEPLAAKVFGFVLEYWRESQMQKAPTAFAIEHSNPGFVLEPFVEEDAGWIAEALMRRFATNNVQRMIQAAAVSCHEHPIETLNTMQAHAYDAAEAILPRHSRSDMSLNVEERRLRYAEREQGIGNGIGIGLSDFDEHTGGLLPGELGAIGAFSKVGKTMFLVLAAVAARQAGYNPIIFSLEMPVSEIEDRVDAMFSKVSYNRLSKRKLTIDEMRTLFEAQTLAAELGALRIESPDEGERTVAHLISRARHTGSDLVLIDQLSFMEETQRYPSEKQRQASILKQLKNEIGRAHRGKLPCWLAVQLRRESLDRKEGPELNDFADAAEVERTCDLLLALSRNKEQRMSRQMLFSILGGRRCEVASWILRWDLVDSTDIKILNPVVGGRPQAVAPT